MTMTFLAVTAMLWLRQLPLMLSAMFVVAIMMAVLCYMLINLCIYNCNFSETLVDLGYLMEAPD